MNASTPYPSDISDKEWEFVAYYFSLLPLDARQRNHGKLGAELAGPKI
jgi:hypothetical protein